MLLKLFDTCESSIVILCERALRFKEQQQRAARRSWFEHSGKKKDASFCCFPLVFLSNGNSTSGNTGKCRGWLGSLAGLLNDAKRRKKKTVLRRPRECLGVAHFHGGDTNADECVQDVLLTDASLNIAPARVRLRHRVCSTVHGL